MKPAVKATAQTTGDVAAKKERYNKTQKNPDDSSNPKTRPAGTIAGSRIERGQADSGTNESEEYLRGESHEGTTEDRTPRDPRKGTVRCA